MLTTRSIADLIPSRSSDVSRASLVVRDLTVRRAGRTVLDRVSLAAYPGELIAIVGASGCGKSTLLAALAGTEHPTAGQVLLQGTDAARRTPAQRRQTAFVPQEDVLAEDLPLARMVDYSARLRGAGGSRQDRAELVATTLASVGLGDAAATRVRSLSGGERRRASIAVELVTEPDLCLLDEPTSGLDPTTATSVVERLRALADDGRTVIFVTHNANDLRRCDRIIALSQDGQLLFNGTPTVPWPPPTRTRPSRSTGPWSPGWCHPSPGPKSPARSRRPRPGRRRRGHRPRPNHSHPGFGLDSG
ncbi:MAG: ABC transporter ATP-binding protein [Actinomycetota bacterium]